MNTVYFVLSVTAIIVIYEYEGLENWGSISGTGGDFSFYRLIKTSSESTHSILWEPGAVSAGYEMDHSLPCSACNKNAWSYTSTSRIFSCHGVELFKHRDSFTFTSFFQVYH
jgi:hypothetical protein